ncbi:hypothetical protein BU23DRAFT_566381 [Bimuria novae-zelandiae CBS 107.79]|uniref:Uncharacterized protein n=1 Tax=Bimuria novae-zelandiae CBS 107.79 TaxID=1447943 RepID=A0A6A5VF57_9PLEO|nr:hypothetical protein BU23DRAFT_566381 [Bimuria novae-zelandiae CBS 107.79]
MKLVIALSLFAAAFASPAAEPVHLVKDAAQLTCSILSGPVNCRSGPGTNYAVYRKYLKIRNCNVWDWTPTYGCYALFLAVNSRREAPRRSNWSQRTAVLGSFLCTSVMAVANMTAYN